jgi:hypothetical protein
MKPSRKVGYSNVRAKYSEIGDEHMINGNKDYLPVLQAKQVFFPRNLTVKDIEGTEVGSLNSKFIKNWKLHHEQKDLIHQSERVRVDIELPYGDGNNKEEYMPEHLRHARNMANRNRNKLRVINAVSPMHPQYQNGENLDRQPQFSQDRAQALPNLSQKQLKQHPIQNQYRDGREALNSIRQYSHQSNIHGEEQSEPREPRPALYSDQQSQGVQASPGPGQGYRADQQREEQLRQQEEEDMRQYHEYLRQENEMMRLREQERGPVQPARAQATHPEGPPAPQPWTASPHGDPRGADRSRGLETGKQVRFEEGRMQAEEQARLEEREWLAQRGQAEEAEREVGGGNQGEGREESRGDEDGGGEGSGRKGGGDGEGEEGDQGTGGTVTTGYVD